VNKSQKIIESKIEKRTDDFKIDEAKLSEIQAAMSLGSSEINKAHGMWKIKEMSQEAIIAVLYLVSVTEKAVKKADDIGPTDLKAYLKIQLKEYKKVLGGLKIQEGKLKLK